MEARMLDFAHLIQVGVDRCESPDGAAVWTSIRHVVSGADVEVVAVIGIALGPHITRRRSFSQERLKLPPIDLPSLL